MTDRPQSAVMERRYRLTGYSDREGEALLQLRSFDSPARVKRAVAALAVWWGAAFLSLFIPVAHFLLVPGFLMFGLVTFVRRLKTSAVVVKARGICPDCGAEQDLDILGSWSESRDVTCRQCHRSLRLTAA
ncbi:MAG: hypothetical protein OEY20_08685 [Gemmatimonadota bacterium]|nr:hypothetical protein [Gemmatimonadota bacterium]MDH4352301.1 hypothetical protein [Gemmatimonadota bacterium]MDH5197314.1 hypothetical protein [Gemmatimonadota bacterium]